MLVGLTSCRSHSKPAPQHTHAAPRPAPAARPTSPPPTYQPPPPPQAAAQPVPRPDAAWVPNGGIISPRWTTIVIHHSATDRGSASSFDKDHRGRGWDELGYHFVIGNGRGTPDGHIEVGTRWHKQKHGAHCKTANNYYNEHGIGICLVGDFTKSKPTARQMASLERLVEFLSAKCRIRPDRVTTHGLVTGRTACPGRHFPIQALRRSLFASAAAGLPAGAGTTK
jgi:hypothetical protein